MTAGRPPLYETAEEMQRIIDLYFLACKVHRAGDPDLLTGCSEEELLIVNDIDDNHPTVTGLALALGMSRQGLINYEGRDKFVDTVKTAKHRVEAYVAQHLYGAHVTGSIFNLKNNHDWKDKTEQAVDVTSKGKPLNNWNMHPVAADPDKQPEEEKQE